MHVAAGLLGLGGLFLLGLLFLLRPPLVNLRDREFLIDNLLVRIHFSIEMIWWTGLAPWEFEYPLPGSLTSTFPRAWQRSLISKVDTPPKVILHPFVLGDRLDS